jgi:hypothetical protein
MRLLGLLAVITSLTTFHHIAGVWAYPSPGSAVLEAEDNQRHPHQLESRAPPVPGSITIPLSREAGHATWTGYRVLAGLAGLSVPEQRVRDTAYLTYTAVKSSLPLGGLVAVMYVPGGGWAAGSVWRGSDGAFEDFSRKAEAFWHSVPVPDQALDPNLNGVNKWHAEAVTAAKAELEFEDAMVQGLWPGGTMIYAYGQVWDKDRGGYVEGSKVVCGDGSSQVTRPCSEWLRSLNIKVVPVPNVS